MRKLFRNLNYEKYYKDILPYLKKEKNQQYFYVILTLGASIFFALFAINPTLSTIARLKREISDSRFVEERLSQKINNLSSLSQRYESIKEDIPFILDAIPQNPQAPVLIAQIQSIAQNSQVTMVSAGVSQVNLAVQTATTSSSFTFELTAQGTYQNLNRFFSDLTNMQRAVSIDSVLITRNADETGGLEVEVKGSAYFKK